MEQTFPFQSHPLPYSYAAVMPHCGANTLYYHHDKYYTDAVYELNQLVVRHRLTSLDLRQLLTADLHQLSAHQLEHLRDVAGLVFNHQFYFDCVCSASGSPPVNSLTRAITTTYGSTAALEELMVQAAESACGSCWLWLVSEGVHGLHLVITPNNFTVALDAVSPILGIDLWEHAFYADNHFDKAAYLHHWFSHINWTAANRRYAVSMRSQPASEQNQQT